MDDPYIKNYVSLVQVNLKYNENKIWKKKHNSFI